MLDRRDILYLHIIAYLILFEKGVGGGGKSGRVLKVVIVVFGKNVNRNPYDAHRL
jgi:hypothetical protein